MEVHFREWHPRRYVLNEKGDPALEPDLEKWADWMQDPEHVILAQVKIEPHWFLSTVFLGMDYRFSCAPATPILWETMIWEKDADCYQDRCSGSLEQAEAMHERALRLLLGHYLLRAATGLT